jgi:hypothetical protein
MKLDITSYGDEYGEYVVSISTKIINQEEDEKLRIALQKFLEGYEYENGKFRPLQTSTDY